MALERRLYILERNNQLAPLGAQQYANTSP